MFSCEISALVDGNAYYNDLSSSGRNLILVATPAMVYVLAPVSVNQQLEDLLSMNKIREAFDLLKVRDSIATIIDGVSLGMTSAVSTPTLLIFCFVNNWCICRRLRLMLVIKRGCWN